MLYNISDNSNCSPPPRNLAIYEYSDKDDTVCNHYIHSIDVHVHVTCMHINDHMHKLWAHPPINSHYEYIVKRLACQARILTVTKGSEANPQMLS